MWKGKLEHIVVLGKFCGKRGRGRQQKMFLESISSWHGKVSTHKLILAVGDNKMDSAQANQQGT